MPLSRRLLLALGSLAGAVRLPAAALAAPLITPSDERDPFVALPSFVDVLMPADEMPSGSELGVHRRIIAKAEGIPAYRRLLKDGCRWLDAEARGRGKSDFRDLTATEQEALVKFAEAAKERSLQRVFFARVFEDTLAFYYTDPKVWSALHYSGPPQPDGFPDHAEPPAGHR